MRGKRRLAVECEGAVLGMHISRSAQPVLVTGDTSGDVSVWRVPEAPSRVSEVRMPEPPVKRLKNGALVFCVRISKDHRLVVTVPMPGLKPGTS